MEAINGVLNIISIGFLMYAFVLLIELIYDIIKLVKDYRNRK